MDNKAMNAYSLAVAHVAVSPADEVAPDSTARHATHLADGRRRGRGPRRGEREGG